MAHLRGRKGTLGHILFGTGLDGDVTMPGGLTTMTRDQYYQNLTVPVGAILRTNGFRIFVSGTLTVGGQIHNDGPVATNASTGSGSAANTWITPAGNTVGNAGSGSNGANGGTTAQGSQPGTPPAFNGAGGVGSRGGAGGNGGTTAGGIQRSVGAQTLFRLVTPWFTTSTSLTVNTVGGGGGSGGAGGGGNGAGAQGGGGGGGGNGGGILWIAARHMIVTGTLSANGANGGNGANGQAANTGGGGGGGAGGGGVVMLTYDTLVNSGAITATKGTRGLKGLGNAGGADGVDGESDNTNGSVVKYNNALSLYE